MNADDARLLGSFESRAHHSLDQNDWKFASAIDAWLNVPFERLTDSLVLPEQIVRTIAC